MAPAIEIRFAATVPDSGAWLFVEGLAHFRMVSLPVIFSSRMPIIMLRLLCPVYFFIHLNSLPAQPGIQWQKAIGGTMPEQARSILQTTDKGFVATGYTASDDGDVIGNHGGVDFWVVKLDSAGIVQRKKAYGGSNNDWPFSIEQTNDEGYVVAGYTE